MTKEQKVIVTSATIILALLSIIAAIIQSIIKAQFLTSVLNSLQTGSITGSQIDKFEVSTYLVYSLFVVMSILPIFWAWQNFKVHKKKWFYVVAGALIITGFQVIAAVGVLVAYLFNLWKDFEKWREEKSEAKRIEQ
jgi:hypothetical protein